MSDVPLTVSSTATTPLELARELAQRADACLREYAGIPARTPAQREHRNYVLGKARVYTEVSGVLLSLLARAARPGPAP